jgi:[acyl-carrier-protein] S-malonyltransferase
MSGMAILCSGQGYQGAGIFDLLADAPEASRVFKVAKFVLDGKDPRQLVREASNDDLHTDRIGQILCCTQAMAAWAVLSAKVPRPLVVAGYSVGELAAWSVAGLLNCEGVLDLAVQRAAAMDRATTQPSGLVAIRGLKRDRLDPICKAHGAYVAIVNAEDQMLVGGTRKALDAVVHEVRAAGAKRTTMLPVQIAAHTPLLADASDRFRQALAEAHLPAKVPVTKERRKWDEMLDKQADPARSKDRIHPQAVARAVSDFAKRDAVFIFDTGLNTLWSANWIRQSGAQRIIGSFNNAAVGTALGQANGIQVLDRSRQVIALCGDGGFNMLMCEFLTAVQHKLPVKVVVYNNSAFGLISFEAESVGLPAYKKGIEFPNPDFAALAHAAAMDSRRRSPAS